jgi:hypothetical protein
MAPKTDKLIALLLQRLHHYEFVVLTTLAAILGAVLISVQYRFASREIARDFGIALFAAGTVGLAAELHTRRTFRELLQEDVRGAIDSSAVSQTLADVLAIGSLNGDLRELGIRRFYRKRENLNFAELIGSAEPGTGIRFLGVCLSGFVDRHTQSVIELKLSQNCSVKFLILDPHAEAVSEHATAENRPPEIIRRDIIGAQTLHDNFLTDRMAQRLRSQIELGYYTSVPKLFIFATKRTMIVGFYLRGQMGEFCPALELDVREGGLHVPFTRHFELMWNARAEQRPADYPGRPPRASGGGAG